ncbi:MAG TPA: hypothetical protein VMW75_20885 [Thermoanaerobaculia bacterium]|nr:hypothetical protein [Thermoanaerobaculia bacterium]
MTKVTYKDELQAAPVVTFHGVQFEHDKPVEVPEHWSGLDAVRTHPHFAIDEKHHEKPKKPEPIERSVDALRVPASVPEARAFGRQAYASGAGRAAPAGISKPQKKAWLEGYDRARRQARK